VGADVVNADLRLGGGGMSPGALLVEAARAARRGALGDAVQIAVAVIDHELRGQPDVHRLQVAQRMVRQLGELNGTLAVAEMAAGRPHEGQLVLPWRRHG
jgi:hypothetical protein